MYIPYPSSSRALHSTSPILSSKTIGIFQPNQPGFIDPFIKYVANNTSDARNHFYGLKEAIPD